MGDFLTATPKDGGLWLGTNGTNGTNAIFLAVIVGVVAWFTVQSRKADELTTA